MLKILAMLLLVTVVNANAQTVLFQDDFTGGADEEWHNPDGGWVAENGHMSVTTACGFQQCNPNLYAGGPDQSSYLISFDFMVTEAFTYHGSGVGFWIALSDPLEPDEGITSGYSIGFGWSSDGAPANANCQIQRLDNSSMTPLAHITGPEFWNEIGVIYHVILGRLGSELVVKKWADGDPEPDWQSRVVDESYLSGYWMPIWWNNIGWIDNVEVTGYGAVSTVETSWGRVKAIFE